MKVNVLKDKYNQIQIVVKKHKETINISFLEKDTARFETDYLDIDSLELDHSSAFGWSGLVVTYAKNRNKITEFRDKEESNSVDYGYRLFTYSPDKVNFRFSLVIHYVSCAKEKK
jgi:hypothetical protein